jgi:uncharacterized membrane-anchored protein
MLLPVATLAVSAKQRAIPIDDLLTLLIVILSLSFILYLATMFVWGAIHRYRFPTSLNLQQPPIEDAIVPFKRPLTSLTIRQLKQRAKTAHIRCYSRMGKPQLIEALQAI